MELVELAQPAAKTMIAELVAEMRATHGAHAVIIYGSHARGDATAESDVDVAALCDVATTTRDARLWRGIYLDGFVYPSQLAPSIELLKLLGGIIALDERGTARALLDQLEALDRAGPPPLAADDAQMRRVWAEKTLARIRRGDVEAHYRRHQLLMNLLEDYFALRGAWFRGAKVALAELPAEAREIFASALAPDASIDAIAAAVELVIA
ncbi:MAG TPA: nucleotidyltransferase domain-containing protein [Kofleriaceae bacterium]